MVSLTKGRKKKLTEEEEDEGEEVDEEREGKSTCQSLNFIQVYPGIMGKTT